MIHELILSQFMESRLIHELNRFKFARYCLSHELIRLSAADSERPFCCVPTEKGRRWRHQRRTLAEERWQEETPILGQPESPPAATPTSPDLTLTSPDLSPTGPADWRSIQTALTARPVREER